MKKTLLIICSLLFACFLFAQNVASSAVKGFDKERSGILHGKIETISYPSKTVGNDRRVTIYTPPGFSEEKQYPVLYLLHGIGGDEYEWLNGGKPQVIMDNLYANGEAVPMIIVMPNGRAMKDDRASGNIMAADKVQAFARFERDLMDDLIPFVERKYPVIANRESRAIAGLSMGGGQALNFGLKNLDKFAWVGGFSSAPNTRAPQELIPDPEVARRQLKLLFISCGASDRLLSFSKRTHDYLTEKSVPHTYFIEAGDHDFKHWTNALYRFAQLLFKPGKPSLSTGDDNITGALDKNFHIYLCLGQSNMEGAAKPQTQDSLGISNRLKVLASVDCDNRGRKMGNWYMAVPPLARCYTGLGPADYFGRGMVQNLPQEIKVGIINISVGGCRIELFDEDSCASYAARQPDWMKNMIQEYGGNPYRRLVEMAKLAQKSGVIKGILLHQGESNNGDTLWPQKIKKVYERLLKDLSLEAKEVPLLAGELVPEDQNGACAAMNKIIRTLPQTIHTAHVVPSAGCQGVGDRLHFSAAGYRELGKRYAAVMLELMDKKMVAE